MSANQRRSGFRLPWLSETEESGEAQAPAHAGPTTPSAPERPAEPGTTAPPDTNGTSPESGTGTSGAPARSAVPGGGDAPRAAERAAAPTAPEPATPAGEPGPAGSDESSTEFLRDLIDAMRKVADEARHHGVEKLKSDAEQAVRTLEADAEKRRQELRQRAETDINGVGEWARAEAERIKAEAEQRVAARQAQLEQQLAAEGTSTEAESRALRARVDDYERELEAYHAQLSEINDPAAFAAAAKRMPPPPDLRPRGDGPVANGSAAATPAVADGGTDAGTPAADAASEVHPAEEEVLAARLAELDQELEAASPAAAAPAAQPPAAEGAPTTTDIVVKGLGSFGAITGFRQSLSGQPGITAVALSLGQSGEFVFRATHAPGFDLASAITTMEGDNASVEPRPEGGLRVTLERSR